MKPSQVLPLTSAVPVNGVTGTDVVVVIGQDLSSTTTHHRRILLTLPGGGDAAARPPALLRPLAAEPAHAGLFLDFDGTLAAIVEDLTGGASLPGVLALLADLARSFALVAVVSG